MTDSYTPDELDFARERIAIMIHDGGLTEDEAREEVVKIINIRRSAISDQQSADKRRHA